MLEVEHPLVSVVIPCYNHEQFIQDSIQSVIDQTYENIELIVIDDGSQDNSVKKIQEMLELCRKRFTRFEFRSRKNKGLSETLNEALGWCEGKYFSPIASDDQMLIEKTALQVVFLEKRIDCVAIFGGTNIINDKGQVIDTKLGKERVYQFNEIYLHQHDLPAPTAMMRLDAVNQVAGYKPELKIEDWYMWLKLSKIGSLIYLPIVFCNYRYHENNISKKIDVIHQERLKIIELYRDTKYYNIARKNVQWIRLFEIGENKVSNTQLRKTLFLMRNIDFLISKILWKYI